jgi:hypothetical protein
VGPLISWPRPRVLTDRLCGVVWCGVMCQLIDVTLQVRGLVQPHGRLEILVGNQTFMRDPAPGTHTLHYTTPPGTHIQVDINLVLQSSIP